MISINESKENNNIKSISLNDSEFSNKNNSNLITGNNILDSNDTIGTPDEKKNYSMENENQNSEKNEYKEINKIIRGNSLSVDTVRMDCDMEVNETSTCPSKIKRVEKFSDSDSDSSHSDSSNSSYHNRKIKSKRQRYDRSRSRSRRNRSHKNKKSEKKSHKSRRDRSRRRHRSRSSSRRHSHSRKSKEDFNKNIRNSSEETVKKKNYYEERRKRRNKSRSNSALRVMKVIIIIFNF
jgi:hypothetical protein